MNLQTSINCFSSLEGKQIPQQEETGCGSVHREELMGDHPLQDQSTARPSEMVVSSSSSAMSKSARNLIGMHTICVVKTKECHNNEVDHDEDSEDRKRKAMDRLRKVSTCNCLLPRTTCVLPYVRTGYCCV